MCLAAGYLIAFAYMWRMALVITGGSLANLSTSSLAVQARHLSVTETVLGPHEAAPMCTCLPDDVHAEIVTPPPPLHRFAHPAQVPYPSCSPAR